MKAFLVIGSTGVAGTAAIKSVRQRHGNDAHITGVWYGRKHEELTIDGVDRVLFGDASDPDTLNRIEEAAGTRFDAIFYATAMGEVGFPSSLTTDEQIAASNRLSFDPLAQIEDRFDPTLIVTYSTFYNLAHQQVTYGAMAHSKAAIEAWTVENAKGSRQCIRAGAFRSSSSMAIKLLVRRNAAKLAAIDDPILQKHFSGVKASVAVDTLQEAVFNEERETYGDTGTDESGLIAAHLEMFDHPDCPFICVCGSKMWHDDTAQPAPPRQVAQSH